MTNIHLAFLAFSVVCILLSDHLGMLYFLGKKHTLPLQKLRLLHRLVWIGLLGMIVSGIVLILPDFDYYRSDPAFLIKMGFVLVLVVNGLFIGRLLHTSTLLVPFRELQQSKRLLLLLSGAASAAGWIGATLIGFFWL
ncbi:hypothetical protein KKC44_03510 [Patescibacteria group bacterium]|nr:hypothetical protein [Patescibacteria group bacterium]MBU2259651.1 hypothetical protein [Patescibacteria group bacterium]